MLPANKRLTLYQTWRPTKRWSNFVRSFDWPSDSSAFDERVRNDVQVVVTSLCVDEKMTLLSPVWLPQVARFICRLSWAGPIGAARIGRVNGELVLNIAADEVGEKSDLNLVVAGSPEKLIMVKQVPKKYPKRIWTRQYNGLWTIAADSYW